MKTPVPSLAAEVWTPQAVVEHIASVRRVIERRPPSATAHKRWRDELPGADR